MTSPWFWTQAYRTARQRLTFCLVCIWILVSPPLLGPTQGREIRRAASVEMNHSSGRRRLLPWRLRGPLPTSPFLSTSEGDVSCEPAWYSEQSSLWRTLCTPWRPFFICNPEGLSFLTDSSFYLFSLLWTAVITTSAQGPRKLVFRFLPLYLFTSIPTFCLTRHFFCHSADTLLLTLFLSIPSPPFLTLAPKFPHPPLFLSPSSFLPAEFLHFD